MSDDRKEAIGILEDALEGTDNPYHDKGVSLSISNAGFILETLQEDITEIESLRAENEELKAKLASASQERKALGVAVDVLNRCSSVANALNPQDPISITAAHRELWAALNAISEEWPIDDIDPADTILMEGTKERKENAG